MSSTPSVSLQGRYKIIAVAGVVILLLALLAYMRVGRLADNLGRGSTFNRVKSVLVRRLGVSEETVKPEATLETLQPQGFDRSELAAALQEEFETGVSEEDVIELATVQDVVRLLDAKGKAKQ